MDQDSFETTCPWCGSPDRPDAAKCASCGASLLVDLLLLEGTNLDERTRFQAARTLAGLGAPAPEFVEAKRRLSSDREPLVGAVNRRFAACASSALEEAGVPTTLRPWAPPKAAAASRLAGLGLTALLLLAAGVAWFATRGPAETATPAATASAPAQPAPSEKPAPPAAGTGLSLDEVRRRTLASVATVSCEGKVGAGFFVEPEVLLTNAHVLCDGDQVLSVKLHDGRELLGKQIERDDWLDYARLEVLGAAAQPLPAGDSTSLEPGAPVVFAGSPHNLQFTLHEGKVSYVGRNYLGVGYLQLNATINPGNSGGPVVNARGEAVGIVSLKYTGAEGIGFALPIEYASKPATPEAAERWTALLEKVRVEDEAEQAKAAELFEQPQLVGVTHFDDGTPGALLLWSSKAKPGVTNHRFRFVGPSSCQLTGQIYEWTEADLEDEGLRKNRQALWMVRANSSGRLFAGLAPLRSLDCLEHQIGAKGTLELLDGETRTSGSVEIHPGALVKVAGVLRASGYAEPTLLPDRVPIERASARSAAADPPADSARAEAERKREFERSWRERFRAAHEKIAYYDTSCPRARAVVDAADAKVRSGRYVLTPAGIEKYEEAKLFLVECDANQAKAKEELHDLERVASYESVPQEWRR